MEGPLRVVEGPNGIDNLLHMRLRVDWDHEGYEGVTQSFYAEEDSPACCAASGGQPADTASASYC